ncbi:phospholipid carrier-dependent glycosyltransferase [[Eubacterium] cellulosolvens]
MRTSKLEWIFFVLIIVFFLYRCNNVFYIQFEPKVILEDYDISIHKGTVFSDDKLYALAGWRYITGTTPDTINFEHPPLAKYLIGLSELLFKNQAMMSLIFSVMTLFFVYLISKKILHIFPFTLLPILILSLDKMYIQFSSFSMLDIYATFFTTTAILFLILNKNKWNFLFLYISVGLALSCKWITFFLIIVIPIYYFLNKNWENVKLYPLGLAIAFLTYSATYFVFFLAGNSILDFIYLQLRILGFHQGMRIGMGSPPPFWILLNFLLGIEGPSEITVIHFDTVTKIFTFAPPEKGISLINTYNPLTWPLSFSAVILALIYLFRENKEMFAIPLTFISLLIATSTGKPFVWYLLSGLPFAFISLVYVFERIYIKSENKITAKLIIAGYVISIIVWSLFVDLPSYIVF